MTATDAPLPDWLEAAWLQRYLQRELTPAETEWFETYVLDKPHLLDHIESDLDLRDGLAVAGMSEAAALPRAARTAASRHPLRHVWLARAAAVAMSAALGWWGAILSGGDARSTDEIDPDPVRIVFDTQRGAQDAMLLFNRNSHSRYVLVEVGVPVEATDIRLFSSGQPPQQLAVTSEGFVTFLWPRSRIGNDPLRLSYRNQGDEVSRLLDLSSALERDQ